MDEDWQMTLQVTRAISKVSAKVNTNEGPAQSHYSPRKAHGSNVPLTRQDGRNHGIKV